MKPDEAPRSEEIAVDPELALLHALRVTLRMTAHLLDVTLHDLPQAGAAPTLDSDSIARCILTRADDLRRWIDLYQRTRRAEYRR